MRELINIPVPFQTFNDLSDFLDGRRSTEEFADVAGRAISEWIAMQGESPSDDDASMQGGYQWKSVFLPSGTRIRVVLRRKIHHAMVDGDYILHEGQEVSPAQAPCMAGGLASLIKAWRLGPRRRRRRRLWRSRRP